MLGVWVQLGEINMNRSIALASLLVAGVATGACIGSIGDGSPNGDGDGNGTAKSSLCAVDTPIRRLTRFEYNNTVRDLVGDTTAPASGFPPEEEVQGFNNQAGALTVSSVLAERYMKAAEGVAERAVTDMQALLPDCDPASEGNDVCAQQFIETFGKRAYRRPLTEEESSRLQALFDTALADTDFGTFQEGIRFVLMAMLQAPSFLYRPEFGGAKPVDVDVVALDSWEMATKLSYMLWNTMPDEELFQAAEKNELVTKEQLAAQARRMLEDDKAKDAVRNFHRQWLLLTHIDTVSKDTVVYPNYDDALRPLWKEEIERFLEHVVLEGESTLQAMLTANYTFANAELAAFYGADLTGTAPSGSGFEKVDVDPQHRAGFLTMPALMATLANANQTSPVFRGKFVREQLMCDILPPPPNDLIIVPPELDPDKTTREQFEEIGNNPDCAHCHTLMNPIGFGFEHYDAIGQWRDQQSGKDIDATGEIVVSDDLDGFFDGAVDLANKLAASEQVATCVASQWFRFAYNRTVTPEDSCNIGPATEAFAAAGYNIKELLVALTQTDGFRYRHQVVAGGAP
jgi:hypothetical protein